MVCFGIYQNLYISPLKTLRMDYISINDAVKMYGKSKSTIKRVLKNAPSQHIKKGERLNTGLFKVLISAEYLNSLFEPTVNTIDESSNDLLKTLQKELENKQGIIDKLLQNQEALIENERNFQILLERANQRADLLEQHYKRNKSLGADIIEDIEESEPNISADEIPTDRGTFNEWLRGYKKSPNQ